MLTQCWSSLECRDVTVVRRDEVSGGGIRLSCAVFRCSAGAQDDTGEAGAASVRLLGRRVVQLGLLVGVLSELRWRSGHPDPALPATPQQSQTVSPTSHPDPTLPAAPQQSQTVSPTSHPDPALPATPQQSQTVNPTSHLPPRPGTASHTPAVSNSEFHLPPPTQTRHCQLHPSSLKQ